MDEKEFSDLSGDYPHRKTLKRSLSPVQYCKIETFSDCIQGTMKIPVKQENTSLLLFGFYQTDQTPANLNLIWTGCEKIPQRAVP